MDAFLVRDLVATCVSFASALAWLEFCNALAARHIVGSPLARKIVHIGTGPIFLFTWLLFSESDRARFLAALVPLSISARFAAIGVGLVKDDEAVKAMSRSGVASELLGGPMLYGLVFVAATLLGWRSSPTAVATLMILCGGDGFADIVGRQYGASLPLPWTNRKSWPGSIAMLLGGIALTIAMLAVFVAAGAIEAFPPLLEVIFVALAATAAESLPIGEDNVIVSVVCALVAVGALGWR